jgi:lysylphosphatidylglycerol synthetase-like protein (DUF2156 family)
MTTQRHSSTTVLPLLVSAAGGVALLAVLANRWPGQGWGSVIWLLALVTIGAIRATAARRAPGGADREGRADPDTNDDGAGALLMPATMLVTMVVLPLLQLATGVFGFAAYSLPDTVVILAAVVQVPLLWMFWRAHRRPARGARMLSASLWLYVLAQPLLIQNWIAGFFVVPAFAAMWFLRAADGQALLPAPFGDAYDTYSARVGEFFPRLGP